MPDSEKSNIFESENENKKDIEALTSEDEGELLFEAIL